MIKHILLLLLITTTLSSFGQYDKIIYKKTYLILFSEKYKTIDSLNYTDKEGLKQGKWIEYDSTLVKSMSMSSYKLYGQDSSVSHGYHHTVLDSFFTYNVKLCGNYFNNKKEGLWTNTLRKTEVTKELFYSKGKLLSPVLFFRGMKPHSIASYDTKKEKWLIEFFQPDLKTNASYYVDNIFTIIDFY